MPRLEAGYRLCSCLLANSNLETGDEGQDLMGEFLDVSSKLTKGSMQHGCVHYRRRCKIRAPCCNEVFDCRHCHNEAKAIEKDISKRHEIPRRKVEKVICSLCNTEQNIQQTCKNCGVCMGEYFCGKCKFFDDDTSKQQFHCDACGICRVGGKENFFHCERCAASSPSLHMHIAVLYGSGTANCIVGCCYTTNLQNKHPCVENSMQHNCPVCFEYLFDSLKCITVMRCGHTMHLKCQEEMRSHSQYTCPICSKSFCDMSRVWEHLDQEVAATPMPEAYQNKMVWILCNDCGANSEVLFHVIAHKCSSCKSYNTRQTKERLSASRSGSC